MNEDTMTAPGAQTPFPPDSPPPEESDRTAAPLAAAAEARERPEPPEPPEEIVRAARLAPEHWFSTVDPGWQGEGVPPDHAVPGRWRSDAAGEIVEWQENEAYSPSPQVLGWPDPTDPVDAALQRAVTGYGPPEDVAYALTDAEVAVLTLPDGSPVTATGADGTPVVPVFTSSRYLNLVGALAFEHRPAIDLLPQLPEAHRIYVNPPSPAGAVLETGPLAELMALTKDGRPRTERDATAGETADDA
ncbi:type VII secretion system-associated protein [Streptomyces pakalii]|uniref:Type VII secretion system-associated protein n=1 Tax=Streptomyces pakalii TaxID=3036494 RepID=A0ABT7DAB9_9ACTN|nr:type VII secretion system-associated protein [Streptomyces pakalii]MDJ1642760.1 type VII secretion system-associated protein [Streptomyces pakalii]